MSCLATEFITTTDAGRHFAIVVASVGKDGRFIERYPVLDAITKCLITKSRVVFEVFDGFLA